MLLIAFVMAMVVPCHAQNNPYKINDQLYQMYVKAYDKRQTAAGRDLSVHMYRKAVALNDHKAQLLALTIPLLYYYNMRNDNNFEAALKALQDKALQYHMEQYFYYGVTNKVNYLLNKHRMYEALTYIQSMEEFAKKNHHVYGIYSGLNTLGMVHMVRMEIGLAADFYRQALQVAQESMTDQDVAPLYRKISECYEELYRYDDMLAYAQKGMSVARTVDSKMRLLHNMAYAAFMLEKYDVFNSSYKQFEKVIGRKPESDSKDVNEQEMSILNLL